MNTELQEEDKLEKFTNLIGDHKMIQFIDGYYNFSYWRQNPKFSSQIDMDKLNAL